MTDKDKKEFLKNRLNRDPLPREVENLKTDAQFMNELLEQKIEELKKRIEVLEKQ